MSYSSDPGCALSRTPVATPPHQLGLAVAMRRYWEETRGMGLSPALLSPGTLTQASSCMAPLWKPCCRHQQIAERLEEGT